MLERGDVEGALEILLLQVENGEKNHGRNHISPSIWRVPSVLRDIRPTSFNPRVVSIGPLHSGDKNVQECQVMKQTYLYDLLGSIGSPPKQTLEECAKKVNASIGTIRACYKDLKTDINDIQLVATMVLDCCFVIEFLQKLLHCSGSQSGTVISYIFIDLILVENQIPFFVLEDIFTCTILKATPSASLTRNLICLLTLLNPFEKTNLNTDNVGTNHHHILDLFHKCFVPSVLRESILYQDAPRVNAVVELNRAGVKFKPNRDGSWSMAMKYEPSAFMSFYWPWGRPTLKMPCLRIQDSTEKILRNLIAYEQLCGQVPCYFISYAAAMDILIDDQEDMAKLVDSKVIINDLGSNGEAVEMINSLGTELLIGDFFYGKEWKELEAYYMAYWPKNIARLRRTYFNSPWNAIALFAGIVLFILTAIQTIFTVKGTKW